MIRKLYGVLVVVLVSACGQPKNTADPLINNQLNRDWLKKIISNSDSAYTKPYYRSDFAMASYYINKKDTTLCQVMRDSAQQVRQIVIEKNGIRSFYAQYYPGGQAATIAAVNSQGLFEGEAVNFFSNGKVRSKGNYHNGQYSGIWETFDEDGRLVLQEEYDANGQRLHTTAQ